MDTKSRNELRPLKAYALTTTVLLTVLSLAAFTRFGQKPRFEEIDVERVNVVERDGTLRLVISNKARAPDAVVSGKSYPRSGGNRAGLIFFNDDGNENGGLIYGGRRDRDGTFHAEAGLLFDQFDQDQAAGITYDDENGRRRVGFQVWDRATVPLGELMGPFDSIGKLPRPARSEAVARLQAKYRVDAFVAPRVFVGRSPDRAAAIVLSDPQGRPRLRIRVDSSGVPALELLDENGRTTFTLPDSARPRASNPRHR